MLKLKIQLGISANVDFLKNTWTFQMDQDFKSESGEFAIIPKEKFKNLLSATKSIRNSMNAHPDCEENSEFADMVHGLDSVLQDLTIHSVAGQSEQLPSCDK